MIPLGAARRLAASWALIATGSVGVGCASAPATGGARSARELIMAYDDARASGTLAFPTPSYESVVRFQLPDGEHRPLRLRLQAEAVGQLEITIYESTLLETPGEPVRKLSRDLAKDDLSNGQDGRWVVEDLVGVKPLKGVIWVGVRKTGGEPTIWACSVVSGQAFVRKNDPENPMGLLPTKRTPMLRIEFAP
jgi:hypothetical protein